LSGIPGLAQIPILKYLFGQEQTDKEQDETVFAITPHVIRGTMVTPLNQRAIDIGTATSIQLREVSPTGASVKPASTSANPSPSQMNQAQTHQAQMNQVPTVQPVSANPATIPAVNPSANFAFEPAQITAEKGKTFVVNLQLSGVQNVYSVPVQINYDPSKLQLVNISNGGFLSVDGQAVALVHREDDTTGTLQITATRPPGSGGVSGSGTVVTLTFQAKASGQTPLTITRGGARDPSLQAIAVNGAQASITVP
jgi:general secretion pathway protein D